MSLSDQTILILGATGRTGKWALNYALGEGYKVHVLARNTQRISNHGNLKVLEGNPSVEADLAKALSGCSALVNVLNISRNSDFPWSSLRTPEDYLSKVMTNIVNLSSESELKRAVICSAWGVGDSRPDIPGWFRWFIDNSYIGKAYQQHLHQEELLIKSSLNWTIVRPVGLTNSSKEERIQESFENIPKPSLTISRKAVGQFLIDSLGRPELSFKKIVVSKKKK